MTTMLVTGSALTRTSDIDMTGSLTPEALMNYCRSRLGSLDDKMKELFNRQEDYRKAAISINRATGMAVDAGKRNGLDAEACKAVVASLEDAAAHMPPGAEKDQILQQRDFFANDMNDGVPGVTKESCEAYGKTFGDMAKDMGTSAELEMMNLQSLMSQRQTAIQLTTNLIQSLGESSKAIAQNLRG